MQKILIYGIIVLIVLVGLIAVFFRGQQMVGSRLASLSTVPQGANTTGTLFSQEPYYGYSYLIAPGNISAQSKAALDGYTMNVSGENVTISYSGRSVTTDVVSGDKLYIVETSFGDDGPGYEGSPADDGFVLVNQGGYVVNTFVV
jgi:hypothetical protein